MTPLASMVAPVPDDELVRLAKQGDRVAFGELVTRHQHRVFSICARWLRNPTLAEEIAQDAFLSAWRGLHTFREEARFDTWLRHIAINKCRNRKVYGKRRDEHLHDSLAPRADGTQLHLVHGGPTSHDQVQRSQANALLDAALNNLPDDQREIIVLRDLEDLDYEEIAELLDVPRGTVKSRLHRARAALATALAPMLNPQDAL